MTNILELPQFCTKPSIWSILIAGTTVAMSSLIRLSPSLRSEPWKHSGWTPRNGVSMFSPCLGPLLTLPCTPPWWSLMAASWAWTCPRADISLMGSWLPPRRSQPHLFSLSHSPIISIQQQDILTMTAWSRMPETSNPRWLLQVWFGSFPEHCRLLYSMAGLIRILQHSENGLSIPERTCQNPEIPPPNSLNKSYFDGLVQDCSISIASLAVEKLQSCTKP